MKKAYITRYSAIGDFIHCSHIPHILKQEGYDHVTFEYSQKGMPVLKNNPYIDEHIIFNPDLLGMKPMSILEKRWAVKMQEGGYDKHFNLLNSIEYAYIAMEDQAEYFMSNSHRRNKYGKTNYYDQTTKFLGFDKYIGMVGELYFTEIEELQVNNIYNKYYKDKFVIICNLSGTSKHKLFYNAESIIKEFLSKHKDAVCITMGDEESRVHLDFKGEQIINRAGIFNKENKFEGSESYPFRQSMLMSKYANCVIGCESGLMVAATLLGSPTIQLMTAASIKNHGGDFKNDFSLQAPVQCSPCHKGPYEYIGCPKFEYLGEKYPACIKFEVATIINQLEKVYSQYDDRRKKCSQAVLSSV